MTGVPGVSEEEESEGLFSPVMGDRSGCVKVAKRLRVLQVGKFYPPDRGGMETHLRVLCQALHQSVDLEVLVSNTGWRTVSELCDGIAVTRTGRLAFVNSTPLNPAMAAAIRHSPATLIHLHWPNPMAAVAYLLSGHRGRMVLTYHCDVIRQRFLGPVLQPVLTAVLERAETIIVTSDEYLQSSTVLRPYRQKCRVIPPGIGDAHFVPPDPAIVSKLRSRYGEQIVLSVGRLVNYKGFHHLIQAMVHAPGRLLIAGDGPLRSRLSALVQSLGLDDRVILCGNLSDADLHALYYAADLFVLASTDRREAFGLVQLEAMAAGVPVVNTHLQSGVPFVSPHGVTGLTVVPGNADAIASAICLLLTDSPLRNRLGQAAIDRAVRLFRLKKMTDLTLAVYQHVGDS